MSKNSKKMKRNRIFKLMVCALLFLVTGVQAQSLKDILNSSAVKDAVTAVTGGKQLSVENLNEADFICTSRAVRTCSLLIVFTLIASIVCR